MAFKDPIANEILNAFNTQQKNGMDTSTSWMPKLQMAYSITTILQYYNKPLKFSTVSPKPS